MEKYKILKDFIWNLKRYNILGAFASLHYGIKNRTKLGRFLYRPIVIDELTGNKVLNWNMAFLGTKDCTGYFSKDMVLLDAKYIFDKDRDLCSRVVNLRKINENRQVL